MQWVVVGKFSRTISVICKCAESERDTQSQKRFTHTDNDDDDDVDRAKAMQEKESDTTQRKVAEETPKQTPTTRVEHALYLALYYLKVCVYVYIAWSLWWMR